MDALRLGSENQNSILYYYIFLDIIISNNIHRRTGPNHFGWQRRSARITLLECLVKKNLGIVMT